MTEVWPVIHACDLEQVLRCAGIAALHQCPGVFLISMHGDDASLDHYAPIVMKAYPTLQVGVNYLRLPAVPALARSQNRGYAATWTDRQLFTDGNLSDQGLEAIRLMIPGHKFFAAVSFKGQPFDKFPVYSAELAAGFGVIPTTSGSATGVAPGVDKVRRMRAGIISKYPLALAVASGIDPENVSMFAPHVSHILVATGISKSFHEFDSDKLQRLMENLG